MDETLVERWNSKVKKGDRVYHLGDVFLGPRDYFKAFWPRLNGSKRLIVGNHDDIKFLSSGGFFKKVTLWRKMTEHGIILSHVPLNQESLYSWRSDKWLINVHGHTHERNTEGPYINVSVEQTNGYPVNLEEIKEKVSSL